MAIIGTFPVFAEAALLTVSTLLDPSLIPKKSIQVETFPVVGLTTAMRLIVEAPVLEAGLVLLDAIVSAVDTLKLTIWNNTNVDVNPASQTFEIKAF